MMDRAVNEADVALPVDVFGYTWDGRYITVIYEQIDDDAVYPVTAFEVPA